VVTAANVNDTTMFQAVVEDIPPVRAPAGRRRGIKSRIARRQIESSTRLGRHRWRVERALSWLSCYRRLQVRWDRGSERFFAFVLLACALVCCNRLEPGIRSESSRC
jgi:transposase